MTTENLDGSPWPLNPPCSCESETGVLRYRNGQHVLECANCGRGTGRNVSKIELGLATRSISSRKNISPSLKWEIIKRAGDVCELCGRADGEFVVGHMVSVKKGGDDSFENLCWLCEEDNSGMGSESMPADITQVIYERRARREGQE